MSRSSRDEDVVDLFSWAQSRPEPEPVAASIVDFLEWRAGSARYRQIIAPRSRDIIAIAIAIDRRTGRLPTPTVVELAARRRA